MNAEQKRVSIVQNDYYNTPEGPRHDTPIELGDDGDKQLTQLRSRATAGVPLTGHP